MQYNISIMPCIAVGRRFADIRGNSNSERINQYYIRNVTVNTQLNLSRIHINYMHASTLRPTSSCHHKIESYSEISSGNAIILKKCWYALLLYTRLQFSLRCHYFLTPSHCSIFYSPSFYCANECYEMFFVYYFYGQVITPVSAVQFVYV